MVCKINCATIVGVKVVSVVIETDISNGLPAFDMVGLLSSDIKESRERVRTALKNSGFLVPPSRITISFSPGDIRKSGTYFDLAVAVAILSSMGVVNISLDDVVFIGELSLDGKTVSVKGTLPIVLDALERGMKVCFVPEKNMDECKGVEGIKIIPVSSLNDVVQILTVHGDDLEKYDIDNRDVDNRDVDNCGIDSYDDSYDFKNIYGQYQARKAAEIAAAGMHNLLLVGPPGTGKTAIAKTMPSIMPELTTREKIEVAKIQSIVGVLNNGCYIKRPFRNPHHTATTAAMMGGGLNPSPGEITLAHKGILYLDELPEFSRSVMEALRQPLEDRNIKLSRSYGNFEFPADFMLLGAMNIGT